MALGNPGGFASGLEAPLQPNSARVLLCNRLHRAVRIFCILPLFIAFCSSSSHPTTPSRYLDHNLPIQS